MANNLKQRDGQQVLRAVYDVDQNTLRTSLLGALVPEAYDEIDLTYVAAGNGVGEIETVTYSLEGSTVATLTLSYDSSDRLSNVVRS